MADVFISYARQDSTVARDVSRALQAAGLSVFWDRAIAPGEDFADAIVSEIRSSRVHVVIFSESTNRSRFVLREIEIAANSGLTVIPYRIGRAMPSGPAEYYLAGLVWIDAGEDGSLDPLVHAVQRAFGRSSQVVPAPAEREVPSPSWWERFKDLVPLLRDRTGDFAARPSETDEYLSAQHIRETLTCHRLEDIGRVTLSLSARSTANALITNLPERFEYVAREAVQVGELQDPGRQIEAVESALRILSEVKSELVHRSGPIADAIRDIVNGWSDLFAAAGERSRARVESEREIENPFIFGNPVRSVDANLFTGRRDVVLEIERDLVRAAEAPTLLLYGQRRMGKTSILNQLPNLLGPSFLPVLIDCQAPATVESQAALLRHVSRCLAAALNLRLGIDRDDEEARRTQGAVALPLSALQNDAYSAFEDWFDMFQRRLPAKKISVLMCLDEFERLGEVLKAGWGGRFLDALRHWVQHRPRLALMFVGSHTFEQLGPEWTNRFISARRLKVTFLQAEDVRQLLTKPTPSFNLTYAPGALEAIQKATNGQPFLTQVLASELVHHMNRDGKKRAMPDDVATALADALERSADYFADLWFSRTEAERQVLRAVARGVRQPPTHSVARALYEYDVLNAEGDFAVPMVGRWVREHHLHE